VLCLNTSHNKPYM